MNIEDNIVKNILKIIIILQLKIYTQTMNIKYNKKRNYVKYTY